MHGADRMEDAELDGLGHVPGRESDYDASPDGCFQQAVDEAGRQLIRDEGQNVSVRELVRRAGFDDSRRTSVARPLNPTSRGPRDTRCRRRSCLRSRRRGGMRVSLPGSGRGLR